MSGFARRGAAGMPRVAGWDALSKTPFKACGAQGTSGMGWLFLGYFLLAKQKKVSRLSVREPIYKQTGRDSDT
ncbi:hypothetical protein [Methylomonas koyamae]|uniref:hypothetical protein n=1 Tax=Methylomonas koyamae TaxID=702114 RepID=UPI0015820E06|nr:hypothetical protein [Methylomonas koyamae]